MPPSTNIAEDPQLKENTKPEPEVRLSRSPHPYHHRPLRKETVSCRPSLGINIGKEQAHIKQLPELWPTNRIGVYRSGSFKHSNGAQRKASSSPSESGTEADDEGAGLLKGLPAPPLRPHKGLKEYVTNKRPSTPSPLLTPFHVDEDGQPFRTESLASKDRGGRSLVKGDELRIMRDRLAQKRRGEFIRRAIEIGLLLIVSAVSYPWTHFYTLSGAAGHEGYGCPETSPMYTKVACAQLRTYGLTLGTLYGFYLLRILWIHLDRSFPSNLFHTIQKAASLDPAPFLYPVVIPISAAISMHSTQPRFLLPNLVLSICSIPPSMIPFSNYSTNLFQPLIALLPILLVDRPEVYTLNGWGSVSDSFSDKWRAKEVLTLLPFIHASLLPSIDFLTTTSLLPAELQLLTTSLINLLIFSESPQAAILKTLLWIGGVSLYVTCRHVLKWAVTLSRIPSWRFRQSYHPSTKRATLLTAIDDCLGGRLGRWPRFQSVDESSEEENLRMAAFPRNRRRHLPAMSLATLLKHNEPILGLQKTLTDASFNPEVPISAQFSGSIRSPELERPRQRRHTLPTSLHGPPDDIEFSKTKSSSQSRARSSKSPRSNLFLSLSRAQAKVLKWVYAGYVYTIVIFVIALPVHWYIRTRALDGNEPVGWALGYLFGDLPSFRLQTVIWNLERWICLPPREEPASNRVLADQIFIDHIGAANTRLIISAYCIIVITLGLIAVLSLSPVAEVDTRRKVFHGMMVVMFLPAIFVDPTFTALALELVLAIFLLLDLFRSSQLPPVSKPLTYFLAPYVDGRDHRGPVIVSPIFLLIGCSIPLWLSLATTERRGDDAFRGWDVATRDLGMIAGVVCVGMGDAAASLFGRRYGHHRWPWSGGKSLEGSAAFVVAVVLGLAMARVWLLVGGWKGDSGDDWFLTLGKALFAASGASLTEAVLTGGNDNVIVPVILWLLVRGLKM